jgi:Trk K+ transport system NAD-binding subunit
LLTVHLAKTHSWQNRIIAEVFERFPELLAVVIIRDQQIQLPRGSTRIQGGDQLLVVASETTSIESFKQLAGSSI